MTDFARQAFLQSHSLKIRRAAKFKEFSNVDQLIFKLLSWERVIDTFDKIK